MFKARSLQRFLAFGPRAHGGRFYVRFSALQGGSPSRPLSAALSGPGPSDTGSSARRVLLKGQSPTAAGVARFSPHFGLRAFIPLFFSHGGQRRSPAPAAVFDDDRRQSSAGPSTVRGAGPGRAFATTWDR